MDLLAPAKFVGLRNVQYISDTESALITCLAEGGWRAVVRRPDIHAEKSFGTLIAAQAYVAGMLHVEPDAITVNGIDYWATIDSNGEVESAFSDGGFLNFVAEDLHEVAEVLA